MLKVSLISYAGRINKSSLVTLNSYSKLWLFMHLLYIPALFSFKHNGVKILDIIEGTVINKRETEKLLSPQLPLS